MLVSDNAGTGLIVAKLQLICLLEFYHTSINVFIQSLLIIDDAVNRNITNIIIFVMNDSTI